MTNTIRYANIIGIFKTIFILGLLISRTDTCSAQTTKTCIINEIKYDNITVKFKETDSTSKLTLYMSDSLCHPSKNGEFIYFKYENFEFLLDTAGLFVSDSTLKRKCKLNIELEKMYVSENMVFKNSFFSKFRPQSLVIKFNNSCLRYKMWKAIRKTITKQKKTEIVSSFCLNITNSKQFVEASFT